MTLAFEDIRKDCGAAAKPAGKVASIIDGDSRTGQALAMHFACECACFAIACFDEHGDSRDTERRITGCGRLRLLLSGGLDEQGWCRPTVETVIPAIGALEVRVNNAPDQPLVARHEERRSEQWNPHSAPMHWRYLY